MNAVLAFQKKWPPVVGQGAQLMPIFCWGELERQLLDLTPTPQQRDLVRDLVSATKKLAMNNPKELVLREVLLIAGVLQDECFQHAVNEHAS